MPLSITAETVTVTCAREHGIRADHPNDGWYPRAHAAFMRAGWKETDGDFLCPQCSGKPVATDNAQTEMML